MRILIACEFSATVRNAFHNAGHDSWSCDLLPSEAPGKHIQKNVLDVLAGRWDMMIAHPPCTHLSVSGNRSRKNKSLFDICDSVAFVKILMDAPIPLIAIENPVGIISTRIRRPDQIIHPWWFGHGEVKTTCLWLKGLPKLTPEKIVSGRHDRLYRLPPHKDRWKERSRTYSGIAQAMANQWGNYVAHRDTQILPALG